LAQFVKSTDKNLTGSSLLAAVAEADTTEAEAAELLPA